MLALFPVMDSDQGRSAEQCLLDDILAYLHLDDTHSTKEILHSILTSTDILTWNSQGEIVYRGYEIRGTDIAEHKHISRDNHVNAYGRLLIERLHVTS